MTCLQQMPCSIVCLLLLFVHRASQRTLTMITPRNTHTASVGDTVQMKCEFNYPDYNHFNNPLLWIKTQGSEVTQINMMRNLNPPFRATGRFDVTFDESWSPHFTLYLTIRVAAEDNGNYTCVVRGPRSSIKGSVTHCLRVRAPIQLLNISGGINTSDSAALHPRPTHGPLLSTSSTSSSGVPFPILTFQENKPSLIACISKGGSPPPYISVYLGRRDITHYFRKSTRLGLHGEPGLRLLDLTTEQRSVNFTTSASNDGRRLRCVAAVDGLPPVTTVVKIRVEYAPIIACRPAFAYIGDLNKDIRCNISSQPAPLAIHWLVNNNRTSVIEGTTVNDHWTLRQQTSDNVWETGLYIREVFYRHFHTYTLTVENAVGKTTAGAELIQSNTFLKTFF